MEKEFIPYQQAIELKELGFDEPCFGCYEEIEKRDYKLILEVTISIGLNTLNGIRNYNQEDRVSAPTFSQAFRWFREKYDLHSYIDRVYEKGFYVYEYFIDKNNQEFGLKTYKEAELECLKKLIEIVKKK